MIGFAILDRLDAIDPLSPLPDQKMQIDFVLAGLPDDVTVIARSYAGQRAGAAFARRDLGRCLERHEAQPATVPA